jgi:ABC-type transport system substrate-binding protein
VADPSAPALPCGAGPFRVARWDRDQGVLLARHDGYHRKGLPYLDGIAWQTGVRATTQRYKFEDGEIDYIRELTPTDVARYRADPAWTGLGRWIPGTRISAIFMNTELPPFDRPAMRRAVAFAVDPSVLEKVRPTVVALDRVLPDGIPGPPRGAPMRRHDLGRALDEMARAGYPFDAATGRGGYPGTIDYVVVPDSFEQAVAEIAQQQLARVGIRIRLRLVSFATYLAEASRRRASAMGWAGWQADFPDPSNYFEATLSSRAIRDEGCQNYAFFQDEELDRVLDEARTEQDSARRMAGYARAEEIVRDQAPWAPMYASRTLELWQPYVRGYAPSAVISPRFNDVWLAPGARAARAPLLGPP